jgi:hypothetical protein
MRMRQKQINSRGRKALEPRSSECWPTRNAPRPPRPARLGPRAVRGMSLHVPTAPRARRNRRLDNQTAAAAIIIAAGSNRQKEQRLHLHLGMAHRL